MASQPAPQNDRPLSSAVPLGDALTRWRSRRLEAEYALVFFDALAVRVREDGLWGNRRLDLALGITADGGKDIIGCWLAEPKAPALPHLAQLRARGVRAIAVFVAQNDDGVAAARCLFPAATVLHSIRHLIADAAAELALVQRKAAAAAMAQFFAQTGEAAGPDDPLQSHPLLQTAAMRSYWHSRWPLVEPVLALPPALRRVVTATSAVDSVSEKLRRRGFTKRTTFPGAATAMHELAFVLRDANGGWRVARQLWADAATELCRVRKVSQAAVRRA